jgi:hypothetical protein
LTEDLQRQFAELIVVHKRLTHVVEQDAETLLSGTLDFEASADGLESITDSFDIELTIPHMFPNRLPRAKETRGRIGPDYEHLNPNGTLCLAVPIEQRRVFFEQPTLLGFVNRLLIPYLYGYCFWSKHGYHPFNEAEHGCEGILRHYIGTLGLQDSLAALSVICFLFEHGYRGHHECPCGSGRKVRACHGPALRALHDHHTLETVRDDFLAIFGICFAKFEKGQLSISRPLRNQLIRLLDKVQGLTPRASRRHRKANALPGSGTPRPPRGSF